MAEFFTSKKSNDKPAANVERFQPHRHNIVCIKFSGRSYYIIFPLFFFLNYSIECMNPHF